MYLNCHIYPIFTLKWSANPFLHNSQSCFHQVLRERLGVHCLLGLTATATRATALNVAKHLGVVDGENAFIRGKAIPENLVLSVSRDEDRDNVRLFYLV